MLAQASSEVITAAKVLDKCDAGLAMLEPTLDYFLNYFQHNKRLVGRSLFKMAAPIPIRRRLLNPTSGLKKHFGSALRISRWRSGRWRTVVKADGDGCDLLKSLSQNNACKSQDQQRSAAVISLLESGQGQPKWEQIYSLSPELNDY